MTRKKLFPSAGLWLPATAAICILTVSCGRSAMESGTGCLRVRFSEGMSEMTRSGIELPDTNDFLLDISDASGAEIYSGTYGASPEILDVPPGSYTISVRSSEFHAPAFSEPVFGDDVCVSVPSGGTVDAVLECTQVNSGIRLFISPDFLTAYPQGVIFLRSEDGRLMYGYSERRIAYFNPGNVFMVLNENGSEKTLLTRYLEPQEILSLNVGVAGSASHADGLTISVDTARVWTDEDVVIGGEVSGGSDAENALSVSQARDRVGEKDVWVTGYIVGGDLTRSSVSFRPPFESATNLAIAARASVSSKESCLSVELPSGDVRDALNLPGHPDHIGRRVLLKGDIVESYFGIVGIKGVSDYILE